MCLRGSWRVHRCPSTNMSISPEVLRAPGALAALPAALACLSFNPALAQAQQDALQPVVVTASRFEQQLSDALPHTTVLTRADIERSQAVDLPTLVEREAGLQITRNGGPGTATSLFVRGASTSQVLLLVDGVPLTKQDASGSLSLEQLMLDQIERIEIVRGNVSAIYGSGAIGGVVQVFTRRGEGEPRASVSFAGGSRGTVEASAGLSGKVGATAFSLGMSHYATEGFSAQSPETSPTVNPDDDGYRNRSASLSVSHELAAGHVLGGQMLASDGSVDFDNAFGAAADVHTSRTKLATVRLFSDNRITEGWNSRVSLSRLEDENRTRDNGAFGYDSRYQTRTDMLQWVNQFALSQAWKATAGVERQQQSIDTNDGFGGLYERDRSLDAAFGGINGTAGSHSVQLNLRYDHIEDTGSETTGYLGYGFELGAGFKLIASASTAFNAPPLGYLHAPFFGNPDLKPELARSGELGLQYAAGAQVVRATWFQSKVRDQLQYDFATNRFENIARARNRGVEVSASGQFGDTGWRASLTSQDPIDEATGERQVRRARTLASLSVSQALGAWRLGAGLRYTGSRPDVGSRTLDSYAVLDLTAAWKLTSALSLFARLENAADERYETAYGYNQAPRGLFMGLRWSAGL
jgi:vitamin B12 transporter